VPAPRALHAACECVALSMIIVDDRAMLGARDPVSVMMAVWALTLLHYRYTLRSGELQDRRHQYLKIHFRHSLGLVTYGWGDSLLNYADYPAGLGKWRLPRLWHGPSGPFPSPGLRSGRPAVGLRNRDRSGYERSLQAARQPRRRTLP